jgi:endo-1,4-beta-xylanase
MRSRRLVTLGSLLAAMLAFAGPPAAAATPELVKSYDFEDGTTQGWSARGGAAVAAVATAAHGGTQSLRVSGRTQSWEGPSVDLTSTLRTGATYLISGYVQLVAGSPAATVQMTVQRTPVGGGTTYDFVASGAATDAGWVALSGSYSPPTDSSQLQLYLESGDATASYDVDDVTVTMTAPPPTGPPSQTGIESDFEDGTAQGWTARGGAEQLANSTADAHGGSHSLLVTGRTQTWMGPALNLLGKVSQGAKYTFSVWVKLAPGEADTPLRLSIERRTAGTPSYDGVVGNTTTTAAGWTHLAGSYTLSHDVDFLAAYVESATGTPSFAIDDFAMAYVPQVPIQTDIPSLKDALAPDFTVGAAITATEISGQHADLLLKHFGSVTPGNALKWDATEPAEGRFSWAESDNEVSFAVSHGVKVRGHTLVWHSQVPAWVFQDAAGNTMTPTPANKALLLSREENHIRAVLGRYRGQMYAWDVVNEVIDENQPDGLRRSMWYQITGLDYIRTAFRVAREVDPAARLFINDYNTEQPAKREALRRVVSALLAEGVPIDGVGHQLHINIERPQVADIEQTIATFGALGLDNQVTELDMSVYTNNVDTYPAVPPEVLADQGYRYADVFAALRRQRAHLSSVTVWGLADDNTWLSTFPVTRLNEPLLFDEQLQAKPAYWGIVDPARLPALTRSLTVPQGRPSTLEWSLLPPTVVTAGGGLSVSFQLRWDPTHVYLRADVNDRTVDRDDAVSATVDGRVTALRRGARTASGYRVDATLPLPSAVASGGQLRFDLRVSDAHQPGASVVWNDQLGTGALGVLHLVDAVRHVDAARGTPVVDGVADRVWARACAITTTVHVQGSGAAAVARLLWDGDHLYVFATVTDVALDASSANPWEQDSVEIFVDPQNAKGHGYLDDAGQYRISYTNAQTISGNFGGYLVSGNLTSATRVVPGGYVVEASIAFNTVRPAAGTLVGLELAVNDATGGVRTAQTTWNDPTGLSYLDTSRWGVVRLG